MIVRLVFFILFWGAAFLVPGGVVAAVAWKVLKPWREKRKAIAQGKQRAKLLVAHQEETCFECLEPVDTATDIYQPRIGWCHSTCFDKITNG